MNIPMRVGFWSACIVAVLAATPLVMGDGAASQPAGLKNRSGAATKPGAAEPSATQPSATQPAATQAKPRSQTPEAIEKFTKYYLKLYGKHLKSRDWMARAMGVISLARIDDPRTTARIIEVMKKDGSLLVRAYAWEALHARQDRLTGEQRSQWEKQAFILADKNALRGDLRIGVVGLIAAQGPTAENKKRVKEIFAKTNSRNPSDIRTLWALGDLLAQWRSPDLIKGLIRRMRDLDDAYRAELVLHRIDHKIPLSYLSGVPDDVRSKSWYKHLWQEGATVMWRVTHRRWARWYKEQEFKEIAPGKCEPYAGLSKLMPRGERILDTKDPRWQKDLELSRFRLNQLDVGFAVDSTASMGPVVRWIRHDVIRMMRAFELISREPRIGVTLYRDHGDKYVVQPFRLTGSSKKLARRLKDAGAKGGGDIPEAVYEALFTVLRKQKWSSGSTAKKVVVLLGDAPPKEKSMPKIEKLVKAAAEKGFAIHCIKVPTSHSRYVLKHFKQKKNWDPKLTSFDNIAEWGGGKSLRVGFRRGREGWTVRPNDDRSADRVILRTVLKSLLKDGYSDRVDPFINVLMEYVEKPLPEWRWAFKAKTRSGKRYVPRDPQDVR